MSQSGSLATAALLVPPQSAMLVGGQALALWVTALDVPIPAALSAGVTLDVDFLGTRDAAEEHHRFLQIATQRHHLRAEVRFPKPFENTPNSAKITIYRGDEVEAEIDYLSHIAGYCGREEQSLKDRAIIVEDLYEAGTILRVMHPFDCLRSRVHNLYSLPSKRNPIHIAQAHLAIDVLRAFLVRLTSEPGDAREQLLPVLEQVISLAAGNAGVAAHNEFGVDVMACIPESGLPDRFHLQRLPQAAAYVKRRRGGRKGGKRYEVWKDLKPLGNSNA
jgi:hypothetical protein